MLGAKSIISAKCGKASWKLKGARAQMRRRFTQGQYAQRKQVRSAFSAIKRKQSAKAPERSDET
jgi:hypothetical protein